MKHILIIESDRLLADALQLTLSGRYSTMSVRSINDAIKLDKSAPISALLIGVSPSQMELTKLRLIFGFTPFLLLYMTRDLVLSKLEGAFEGPITASKLLAAIEAMVSVRVGGVT